jgi:hypothetical protein
VLQDPVAHSLLGGTQVRQCVVNHREHVVKLQKCQGKLHGSARSGRYLRPGNFWW